MKTNKKLFILFTLILFLVACNPLNQNQELEEEIIIEEFEEVKEEISQAKMMFVGDILLHMNIVQYAKARGGDFCDFDYNFELIKNFVEDADLFIVNNEFSVNPERPNSGYPCFVAPRDIHKSFSNMGVDIVTTANNHALDSGIDGLHYTIDSIRDHGMENVGTQKLGEDNFVLKDVNGIKIGVLSYTESVNGLDVLLDTAEKEKLLNRLEPEQIKTDIEILNSKGAEFVIVYPHWGIEYSSYPEADKIELARNMIDWGADLIMGNHPHVVQPKETYFTEDGRKGVIYYSLGNLLSNQTLETIGDIRVEHGLLAEVNIEKSNLEDRARIVDETHHVTWLGRRYDNYGLLNRVHIVEEFINGGKKENLANPTEIDRMIKAKKITDKTVNTKVE